MPQVQYQINSCRAHSSFCHGTLDLDMKLRLEKKESNLEEAIEEEAL